MATTHMAHRYGAPKACPYMVKYADGSIDSADLLMSFLGSLPNLEVEGLVRLMRNKHGALAQHFVFQTTATCAAEAVRLVEGHHVTVRARYSVGGVENIPRI